MNTASTMLGTSDSNTSQPPAAAIARPNSRRRENSASNRGPPHIPSASPTKTAANSVPYPGEPARRSATKAWASPITMPPAANAPSMPRTSPRTNGVVPTYRQPSTAVRQIDSCTRVAVDGGGNSSFQMTTAETRKVRALT